MSFEEEGLSPRNVEAYLAENTAVREALRLPARVSVEAHLLARGEYNANFTFVHPETGRRLLFRVNLGSQMHLDDQIGYEAHALELLAPSGRTPKVLYVDSSKAYFGKGVLVEEWLPGRPLDYATDMNLAAALLADIHAVALPSDHALVVPDDALGAIVDECEAMFAVYERWSEAHEATVARVARLARMARETASRPHAPRVRHIVSTELNSRNFLINEGDTSYLVDWEKPVAGEAEQDIAHFLVPTTTFWKTDTVLDAGAIDRFVEAYVRAVAGRFSTDGIRERTADYLSVTCLRGLTWCAMAYAQHMSGERSVADDYTLGKIEAYLDDRFLAFIEREYFGVS
ncbi:phosphotransferase family protein [Raoultibacter phocaeensis]|uniref:phosphotransferase family protein n=1 Tax=Raoultibacter phocaeensis TaxID=2479841 RepID=UPI0015D5A0F0|nr:phosphotransferase [Raoultibacter phocaeensis]